MLAGRSLFAGDDVSQTLARVLERQPDFSVLPSGLHPRIRFLLERCLEKEGKNRYSSISDARVEIQKALSDPSGVLVQPAITASPKRKLRLGLPWIAAIVVLSLILAGVAVWKFKPTEPRQVMRFDYDLPESQQFSDLTIYQAIAVSPDGKQFVYSTHKGLYLRSVDELTAKLIAGTEESTQQPFFSPDGKWIGYFSATDFQLKKIAVNGGAPVVLYGVAQPRGTWWNEDDTIIYGQAYGDIMRISANGGTPESIVKQKSGSLINPQILPDGKSILYTSYPSNGQPKIMVRSIKSGETKELFPGFEAHYLPTGHIIYTLPNNNILFAVQFDLARLDVKKEAAASGKVL